MRSEPYYQDDYCTIFHGDCREVLPTMGGIGCVITDPPYGTGCAPRGGARAGTIDPCSAQTPSWDVFSMEWASTITSPMAVFCGIGRVYEVAGSIRGDGLLIYAKSNPSPLGSSYEPCVTRGFGFCRGRQHCVAYNAANGQTHPTQKPLEVMTWIVGLSPDGTILDPFMGSGTTLRAAKDLRRKCIGIELEEQYCEIAAKRLQQEVLAL